MPRTLNAKMTHLAGGFKWVRQAEIDWDKVEALMGHVADGGEVPPPVLVRYGDTFMPLDGHHRCSVLERLHLGCDAWVVEGHRLERACQLDPDFDEKHMVLCGGVPAIEVAARWNLARAC